MFNRMMILPLALFALGSAVVLAGACWPHEEPCDSGPSSSSSSSTGTAHVCPPLEERVEAGELCVEDCDCCGGNCGSFTGIDGVTVRMCRVPCPLPTSTRGP